MGIALGWCPVLGKGLWLSGHLGGLDSEDSCGGRGGDGQLSCTWDSGLTGPAVTLDEGPGVRSQGHVGTSEDGRSLRFQDWTRPPGGREGQGQGRESRAECGGSWEAEQRRGLRAERGLRERRVSGGVSLAQKAVGPGARASAAGVNVRTGKGGPGQGPGGRA